jgi:hypothetical protein
MLKLLKALKNPKGISIAELLIGSFILAIISAITLQAFIGQKEASNMQAQVSDAQQSATFSLAEITKAVRNAGYRTPGTPPRGCRIGIGTLGHDTLIIYNLNDSTLFYLDYTTDAAHPALRKVNNLGADEVYAENIEDVDFFPVGTNALTVSLTARTEDIDKHLNDYRRRTVSSNIMIPNAL